VGIYTATFCDGSLCGDGHLFVLGTATRFDVIPHTVAVDTAQKGSFRGVAFDATGNDISSLDGFSAFDVPGGVTCDGMVSSSHSVSCFSSTPGSYSIGFSDAAGLTAYGTLEVSTATNALGCSFDFSDVGCWVATVWGTLTTLPGEIAGALYSVLFVSQTGPSYLDLSGLTGAIVPSMDCREGQLATAPDEVHCVAFPFSIPFDLAAVAGIFDVTPTPPSLEMHLYVPPIDVTEAIPLDTWLTDDVMTWVRDAELVLFVVGLAVGTYRWVQASGA
jgi:hypothetical protein